MTGKCFDPDRRKWLKLGAATATLPLFNINHAFAQDVRYDGSVFDAKGATLRMGAWGGVWRDSFQTFLFNDFTKDFNCKIEYDSTWPWFPKFVANGSRNPPIDIVNWNPPEMFKTAMAGDFFQKPEDILPNLPNSKNLWPFATSTGLGVTWGFNRMVYAYRTDRVYPPPTSIKDFWKPAFAGKRATYVSTNMGQMLLFLAACRVFGKNEYDLNAGYEAMRALKPIKISDFSTNMQILMDRGEVIISVQCDIEPLQSRDRGMPVDIMYWKNMQPLVTQTCTISRYAQPIQKKLAYALLNRMIEPSFMLQMGKEYYMSPTVSNAILPDNLVKTGIANNAEATQNIWAPDWKTYLEHEDEIMDTVQEIFTT